MKKIIRNSLRTPDGTEIRSKHRHDYTTHTDANGKTYMVDGGLDYLRRSGNGDEEDTSLFNDEPHEVQRAILSWGTYGLEGNSPLKWVAIKDMSTSHLKAALKPRHTSESVTIACMEKELKERALAELVEQAQELHLGYDTEGMGG